jgi:hypothetical protein
MGESGSPKSVPGRADRVSELLRAVKAKLAADTVKRGLYCCGDVVGQGVHERRVTQGMPISTVLLSIAACPRWLQAIRQWAGVRVFGFEECLEVKAIPGH